MSKVRDVVAQIFMHLRTSQRRPSDLIISIVAFALLASMSLLIEPDVAPEWELTVFGVINDLPDSFYYIIWPFMQYGVFITIPVVAAIAFYYKKLRLGILLLFGGIGIYYAARIFKSEFPRGRPGELVSEINAREAFAPWSKGFTSGHAAVAATIATFSHYYLRYKWQIISIITLVIVSIGRIYVGAHLPIDVLGGVALGVGVASLINFIVRVPIPENIKTEDTKEWIKQYRPRHPGDIIRIVIAGITFAATTVFAITGSVGGLEEALFRTINLLPSFLSPVIQLIMQFGALFFVFLAAIIALFFRHNRLFIKILSGGTAVWLMAKIAKALVDRERPFYILNEIVERATNSGLLGFPSGHASVAALIATVSAPYVTKRWARIFWILAWTTAIGRVFVGAHLPLDIIAGLSLGWFSGSLLNLAFGKPEKKIPRKRIMSALKDAHLELADINEAKVDARGSVPLIALTKTGKKVFIKLIDTEHRNADILYRLWRFITLRQIEDDMPFATAKHIAEHEAYLSIQAAQAGVRAPKVLLSTSVGSDASIIVNQYVEGKVLSEYQGKIDKNLIEKAWKEVAKLHENRISHRDLRAPNILIDAKRQPWLIDFSFSQTAATDLQLQKDLVELMASLSLKADPNMVVQAAIKVFGKDKVAALLPYLQNVALTSYTKKRIKKSIGLLDNIAKEIRYQTGARRIPKARLTRADARWVIFIIMAAALSLVIVQELDDIGESTVTFARGDIPLLLAVILASFMSYVFSALVITGAALKPTNYTRTLLITFATTTLNRITPKGVGGAVLLEQYLERNAHDRAEATASVSIVYATGAIVHSLLTVLVILAVNPDVLSDIADVNPSPEQLLIGSIVIALAVISLIYVPQIKGFIKRWTKETKRALSQAIKSRSRSALLFGGSIGITLSYAIAFSLSVNAFGPNLPILEAIFVYLAANVLSSAAPTPGGLGATEAALSVGLTLVDVPASQAVASVLVFRLITFWLPIIPGVFALRYLRKQKIL